MVKETILWQVKCCSMNQGCDLGGLRELITCIEKVVRWKKWFGEKNVNFGIRSTRFKF